TVRIVLQWSEAHDALPLRQGDDPYREPLARLRLVAVVQPDPSGKTRPADDLEVAGESVGTPIRLEQSLNSATYEAVLEVKVPKAGRVGVMVEGKLPESAHAPGEATVPLSRKKGEVRPRLVISSDAGRATWADLPATAGLGMPADARRVLAVGSEGEDSASGVHGAALMAKPDLLSFGDSTAAAASFAAGFAASSSPAAVLHRVRDQPGALLVVPGKR
ncbi:MAG: hypothetical protein K2W96_08325, partial [Gemmataceae bacterium]|nr:hypothetical protein [Gemmataceae bacterium]